MTGTRLGAAGLIIAGSVLASFTVATGLTPLHVGMLLAQIICIGIGILILVFGQP